MSEGIDARLSRIEGDIASLKERTAKIEGDMVALKERTARIEGIVDTIKWSIWLGFTLLAILVSILKIV